MDNELIVEVEELVEKTRIGIAERNSDVSPNKLNAYIETLNHLCTKSRSDVKLRMIEYIQKKIRMLEQ